MKKRGVSDIAFEKPAPMKKVQTSIYLERGVCFGPYMACASEHTSRIHISRWSSHIGILIKGALEKSLVHIELMKDPILETD